jgi:hypothetical protein
VIQLNVIFPLPSLKINPLLLLTTFLILVVHSSMQLNISLTIPINQIKTAVMVNRNHKNFPIKADFKGISLSTSTNEHVSVILDAEKGGIFLRYFSAFH